MNEHTQRSDDMWLWGWRKGAIAIAMMVCLVPVMAPAQQPQEERLPAGELPSQAVVLLDDSQTGWPIDIDFVDVDIRDVVRFFSTITGLNIVVDPGVSGPVTMTLYSVPWDAALISVLRTHDLGYAVDRNVVRITTTTKLAAEAEARARLVDQERAASPLFTETVKLSYARADEMLDLTLTQMTDRGDAIVDVRTNSLILKDTRDGIDNVVQLLESLDIPAPQVSIAARIVETTRDFSRELGVQWGFNGVADAAHGNTTGLVFPNSMQVQGFNAPSSGLLQTGIGGAPYAVNLPTQEANSGVALTLGSVLDTFRLDMTLSAMEDEGRGKVISTPKVSAQNNVPAYIESGQRIPVQTLVDNTASITFINANLQLRVTPQITVERTIMLDIMVDKSEPDFSQVVVGIPTIFTRKAETRVLVRDGGTTVIGGIFQLSVNEGETRVPGLHRIPLLGWLFKSQTTNQSNNELLIFITPTILDR